MTLYFLAAIGAVTLLVLLWKGFGPDTLGGNSERTERPAPDDDPEFLRRISEQQRKPGEDNR
ncbi:hypothetical protein [Actinopolyspora mortivallis]|uniref:hypothetical protein n=1 Tax=Actinopolyspora mortivallis TaxID=33906 RepID=UPI0003752086|nr:hypothetical protein [Actinopolyspora mortivallis]